METFDSVQERNWEIVCENIENMPVEELRLFARRVAHSLNVQFGPEFEADADSLGEVCNDVMIAGIIKGIQPCPECK